MCSLPSCLCFGVIYSFFMLSDTSIWTPCVMNSSALSAVPFVSVHFYIWYQLVVLIPTQQVDTNTRLLAKIVTAFLSSEYNIANTIWLSRMNAVLCVCVCVCTFGPPVITLMVDIPCLCAINTITLVPPNTIHVSFVNLLTFRNRSSYI
jgi:hypothetical protein